MSTNIQHNTTQNQIIGNKFYIDSSKFLFDSDLLKYVNIPENYLLIDADNGDVLEEIKKKGLKIQYRDSHFYIANYTKVLRGQKYNKFVIMASAKCSDSYFNGITNKTITDILNYLKSIGRIDFDDIDKVINNIYLKDTDVTQNYVFPNDMDDEITDNFKRIKKTSILPDKIRLFNSAKNQGIQFGNRGLKEFFKIYNKSLEIQRDKAELINIVTPEQWRVLFENIVYRYELTLRNAKDFEKFGISNKFVDLLNILEYDQEKIRSVKKEYYDNYMNGYIPKQKRNYGELSPTEMMIFNGLIEMHTTHKDWDILNLESWFLRIFEGNSQVERNRRNKAKKVFYKLADVLYSDTSELKKKMEKRQEIDRQVMSMFF